MAKERPQFVKIIAFAGIAFISFLLIFFFIGTDILSSFFGGKSVDPNIIATVNGEDIHRFDFYRFRDQNFPNMRDSKMENFILEYYIGTVLMLQEAKRQGFTPGDDLVMERIREIRVFQDEKTKQFDSALLKGYLHNVQMSFNDFYRLMSESVMRENFMEFIAMGMVIPEEDVVVDYISGKSKIQIQYAHISDSELRKRFEGRVNITDAMVTEALSRDKTEIKNPKTDRERIRRKLVTIEIEKLKMELITKINEISKRGGSFAEAAALLGGTPATSAVFKIGGAVKENRPKGRAIPALSSSPVFLEDCFRIKRGGASRVIASAAGLYVFTPLVMDIPGETVPEKDAMEITRRMSQSGMRFASNSLLMELSKKARIRKNLKPAQ